MPTRIKAYSVGLPSLWQTRPPKKIIWLVVVEETPTATRLVTSILPHATSRTNLDRNRNGSSRGAKFCRSSHSNKRLLSSSCWRWGNESPQSWGKWDVDVGFKRTTLPQDTATWRCSLRKCSSCFPQNKRKSRQRKWMTSFRMSMKEIREEFEIELKKFFPSFSMVINSNCFFKRIFINFNLLVTSCLTKANKDHQKNQKIVRMMTPSAVIPLKNLQFFEQWWHWNWSSFLREQTGIRRKWGDWSVKSV